MPDLRPSPALQAAQARLLKLRESWGITPNDQRPLAAPPEDARTDDPLAYSQIELYKRRKLEAVMQGVHASDALKANLVPAQTHPPKTYAPESRPSLPAPATATSEMGRVKVYPSLALAMLEQGLAAPGRVYWLLRFMDTSGRGWVDVTEARNRLTGHGSDLHVYTWRRLRQILNQGEDILWHRDGVGRLWLAGSATLALNLAVERLTGQPVAIPIKHLLGGIQAVRAQFYASFHSGRKTTNPISREKLRAITSVPERTQVEYEAAAHITPEKNLAIGERHSQPQVHERAWLQGNAIFHFVDSNGYQGKAGREYIAWHLPNSYTGPHATCCKGRQKKINQRLVDLVMKGMRGNGRDQVDKVFWPHGAAAGAAFSKHPAQDAYWPQQAKTTRFSLWYVLPGQRS